ncbi:MAG TPA: FxLYD domain-containing protein [Pyrinomonadaceae bacterium]
MSNSFHEELLLEPKTSTGLKIIAAITAVAVAALLLGGYFLLRQRHADSVAATAPVVEPRPEPKAIILVDDATLGSGKSTLAGTIKNTSNETLSNLQVELELKSRKGAGAEKRLVQVQPADLQPNQEGRYSIELPVQDYASARLVGLKSGADLASVPYTTGQGQKRKPERLESKTITVDKRPPGTKRDEFLNSPDNPARVP